MKNYIHMFFFKRRYKILNTFSSIGRFWKKKTHTWIGRYFWILLLKSCSAPSPSNIGTTRLLLLAHNLQISDQPKFSFDSVCLPCSMDMSVCSEFFCWIPSSRGLQFDVLPDSVFSDRLNVAASPISIVTAKPKMLSEIPKCAKKMSRCLIDYKLTLFR